jgi:uncharacterized membrane protein YeaQ/YmgE (transglycosylase-associated protein family)
MLSHPSPKKIAGVIAAWVASNVMWTLLSGAVGAFVSAALKEKGVLKDPYSLVAIGFLVAAICVAIVQKIQQQRRIRPVPADDRLAVAIYGEEQKELQRRAQQRARENVDQLDADR